MPCHCTPQSAPMAPGSSEARQGPNNGSEALGMCLLPPPATQHPTHSTPTTLAFLLSIQHQAHFCPRPFLNTVLSVNGALSPYTFPAPSLISRDLDLKLSSHWSPLWPPYPLNHPHNSFPPFLLYCTPWYRSPSNKVGISIMFVSWISSSIWKL